ncbi:MAG: flagellin [Lachnospiraceae bacterium]|nr:flagellin [Lachnospiraceae bacterium]
MVVAHNMNAANAQRQLNIVDRDRSKVTEKLSSGYRINRAADDAAGLAISEKMRSQVRGLDRAATNAQDGVSVVQTAEGALSTVHSMLQRMNELATQAANDTNTTTDRDKIKDEMDQLTSEIDRVQSTTTFNTQKLLTGDFSGKKLQVGAQSGQTISITISNMNASSLGVTGLSVSTSDGAGTSMSKIQGAIDTVSKTRSKLGAIQNRLEYTIDNLNTTSENTQAAESRIRDTDMAKEMVSFSKDNILAQAGQSMLSQANQSTQGVLSLLQ